MPNEWGHSTIGAVSECNTDTYTLKEGWPYVNYLDTGSITRGQIEQIQHIGADDKLPSRARRKVLPGDLVYSTVRPNQQHYGMIFNPVGNMLVSTGFVVLRGLDGVSDTRFLYYFLIQGRVVEYLQTIGENSTSAYPSVRPTDIQSLPIPLPPLSEQKAIASILAALDDKIELNRRMNETLEEMARALFKSWFVDFDPVRAKAEGKKPYGMDAETAALFPDRLVDSEIGPIPEGWEVRPLDQIADFINGAACQKFSAQAGQDSLPVVKIREMTRGISKDTDRASLDVPEKYRINDGDVLFSWSATLLCEIWTGGAGFVNQHIFKVASEEFPRWFYLYWTKHHLEEFKKIATDKATTMGHIKRSDLKLAKAVVPPISVIDLGSNFLANLDTLQVRNSLESRTLAELRDLLLPKLLSGEIRVKDAEKMVEDIA